MQEMSKRTLEIKILSESRAMRASTERFVKSWEGGEYGGEFLTFTTPGMFFSVINSRRWDLIAKLQELGKSSIRELARQLNRDVRRVHDDIKILQEHGIIEQDDEGVSIPYSEIHADFTLKAEAA